MTVQDLGPWLKENKEELVASLLDGSYQPREVRGVEIPKPGGGVRQLGIPTVVDRLVQQAILQVLDPEWDGTFSESSYGFRRGRSPHDALRAAQDWDGHASGEADPVTPATVRRASYPARWRRVRGRRGAVVADPVLAQFSAQSLQAPRTYAVARL